MEIIVKGSVDFGPDLVAKALFGKSLEEAAKDFIREEHLKNGEKGSLRVQRAHEDG